MGVISVGKTVLSSNRVLLWTNSSPTAQFAPQTVNLDLSKYNFVEIFFRSYTGWSYSIMPGLVYPIGEKCMVNGNFGSSAEESGSIFGWERSFETKTTGIVFANAAGCPDNGAHAVRNDMAIPLKIYGVKY
jgi:hypothetical protein